MNIDFIKNNQTDETYITSHNSILILGKGDSEYKNLKITYPKNITEVKESYGEYSELTKAYIEAKKLGAEEVYVCNCHKLTDYVQAIDLVAQSDFAFVCPLFTFSTTYTNGNKEYYFAELYSEALSESFSNIIFTEKHASLYEDITHFLTSMKYINYTFKESSLERMSNGQAMAFVLNNLKDYKYANVVLASIISLSSLRYYPQKDIGDVVFDITSDDVIDHEFVYFANDLLAGTTIENLLDYHNEKTPEKMLLINIIKNRINMALDYEQFTGELMNPYTKIKLKNYTNSVMNTFQDVIIQEYSIDKIDFVKAGSLELNINIYITIKPFHSIEYISMKVEV